MLKASLSAAIALIVATGFIMIMNGVIDYGVTGEELQQTKAVMATFALTMAGFVCLTVISMPPNKFRIAIIISMFAVSLLAIWADNALMSGTFLGMDFVPMKYAWWIIVSSVIALVVVLVTRWIISSLDKRYGKQIADGVAERVRRFRQKRLDRYNEREKKKEEKGGEKD